MKIQSEKDLVDLLVESSTVLQRLKRARRINFTTKINHNFSTQNNSFCIYTVLLAFQGDKEESVQHKKVVVYTFNYSIKRTGL